MTPKAGSLCRRALHLTPQERSAFVKTASRHRSAVTPVDTTTSSRSALPPVVGRKDELALLQRLLDDAGPPVLLLAGEPGMGKTRLLREATTRARAAGWTALEGSCSRRGGQELYAPLLEALVGRIHSQPQESCVSIWKAVSGLFVCCQS